MAFVAKSFIGDARDGDIQTTTDHRGGATIPKKVFDYINGLTLAGSGGAREIQVTCSTLAGDRIHVLVTAEIS